MVSTSGPHTCPRPNCRSTRLSPDPFDPDYAFCLACFHTVFIGDQATSQYFAKEDREKKRMSGAYREKDWTVGNGGGGPPIRPG